MIKFLNKSYLLIFCALILFVSFFRFNGENIVFENKSCTTPMLWLHAAGSQERLKYALNNKYCGVEIDTTFSYDRGLIASYNNPNDIVAPSIEQLISNNLQIKYWWLDLKNLNSFNANEISEKILDLSSKYKTNTILIESHDFIGLWLLNTKPDDVYKIYWLAKGPNKNSLAHWSTPLYYLRSVLANIIIDPDFVSMFHYQVSRSDYLWVGKRKRFAFTINNIKDYNILSDMRVSVMLTDNL